MAFIEVMKLIPFFLCGKEVTSNLSIPVTNPYNDKLIADVYMSLPHHIDLAVKGALESQIELRKMPLFQRAKIIRSAHDYLLLNRPDVIDSIVCESGKPLRYAQAEFERCLENLIFCSEAAKQIHGETVPLDASSAGFNKRGYWFREPVGTVLAISPFNFPLNLVAHKLAPAVAAGCPIILKPSSKTPLTALWLCRAFLEAGLPPKALSCLIGSGNTLGLSLAAKPDISKITFTGSHQVGLEITRHAGIKKLTLELGSNSAAIVDDDLIDFDYAVKRLCLGAFYYQGQVCISVQRIYVIKKIFSQFLHAFINATKNLKSGDPADPETDIGPMITLKEAERVKSWIDKAARNGAQIHFGGQINGSFVSPTVISSVKPDDPLVADEVFGPVVVVEAVDTIEEAIIKTNQSRFGLQAGIFTRRIDQAEKAISDLHVGGVMINDIPSFRLDHMPYGGVKHSGIGREGARYAIEEMTTIKMIVINNSL